MLLFTYDNKPNTLNEVHIWDTLVMPIGLLFSIGSLKKVFLYFIFDFGYLVFDKVNLVNEQLDLKRKSRSCDADTARCFGDVFNFVGFLATKFSAACTLKCFCKGINAYSETLLRRRTAFKNAFELSPNMLEKIESYSGNTWSSATITWRFRSATLPFSSW